MREHRPSHPGARSLTSTLGSEPGKRALTDSLQRRASPDAVQARGDVSTDGSAADSAALHSAAAHGISGNGDPLPHQETIQRSFGAHDVSGIRAHVGGAAAEAATSIGAEAYATGNDVAFRSAPDLHTAAHEAAHVFQQQAGVQLAGGVGEVGDPYERHADAVADKVVAGESAASLLGEVTPAGGGAPVVQRIAAATPVPGRVRVTALGLNVRRSPDKSSHRNIIGAVRRGHEANVLGRDGDWVKIQHQDGEGYVHGGYVQDVAAAGPAAPHPAPVAEKPAENHALPPVTIKADSQAPAPPIVAPAPDNDEIDTPVEGGIETAAPVNQAAPTPTPAPVSQTAAPVSQTAAPVSQTAAPTPAAGGAAGLHPTDNVHETTAAEKKKDLINTTQLSQGYVHQDGAYRGVYTVAGHQVLVFLPENLKNGPLDAFVFFHGMGARFSTNADQTVQRNGNNLYIENAAHNAQVAQHIAGAARNLIGVVPIGKNTLADGDASASWGKDESFYATLVDTVVARLAADLHAAFTVGSVAIAGHSAGGQALGFMAAGDERVKEMTLQDAGYGFGGNYTPSFLKARDWFMKRSGKDRILRVITHNEESAKGATSTRHVLYDPKGFSEKTFNDWIAANPGEPLTVKTVFSGEKNHGAARKDGMGLEAEIQVWRKDPGGEVLQGTMFVFLIHTDHFGVRNKTMGATIDAAGQNVGEDFGKR